MAALIYDIIMAVVLSLGTVLSISTVLNSGEVRPSVMIVTLFCSGISALAWKLKTKGRIILVGILSASAGGMILSADPGSRLHLISQYSWLLWIALGCFACVLFEQLTKRLPAVRLIPAAIGLAVFTVCLIQGITVSKSAVSAVLLYVVLTIIELLQSGWAKEGDTDPEAHVIYTLPFVGLMFFLLFSFQMPAEPYEWKLAKSVFKEIRASYEVLKQSLNLKKGWDDGEAEIGFSGDAHFFGTIDTSPYEVFKVTAGPVSGTKLYLSGKSFDTFDGRKWIKQDDSEEDYRTYDLLEIVSAAISCNPEHIDNYIRASSIEITYKGIRTSHVFTPEKTIPSIRGNAVIQQGGDLYFAKHSNQTYRTDFYMLNRQYEGFDALLRNARPIDKTTFSAAKALFGSQDLTDYTYEGMLSCRKKIYEVYGNAPILSERMRSLLESELAGADSDYEKLCRLESILSGMTYTNDPGELPQDIDSPAVFLDYLIFDAQEGYCTHFATAFVLMARAQGIPARYVQGYSFSLKGRETEVYSDKAHAWAEAYVSDVGWIGFEPSPGRTAETGWHVSDSEENKADSENSGGSYYGPSSEPDPAEDAEAETMDPALTVKKISGALRIPLLLVLSFLVIFIPAEFFIRRIRYGKMTDREKAGYLFNRGIRIMKYMGLRQADGETLSEFAVRAEHMIPERMLEFVAVYEDIIYGEREVLPSDIDLLKRSNKELFAYLIRKRKNRKSSDIE